MSAMVPVDGARLWRSWVDAAVAVGARGDVADVGARLLASYAEPHRGYHNLTHLAEMLANAETLTPYAENPAAVVLAAWFHDAVYDPRAVDSEERSAALAESELAALRVPAATAAHVAGLVRITVTHLPDDRDTAVVSDADLAVLASGPERYRAYVEGVRREYAHVSDELFRAGRAAILRGLLDRERIFQTDYGSVHWEAPARRNITDELRAMDDVV